MNLSWFGIVVLLVFALMFVAQIPTRKDDPWGRTFDIMGAVVSVLGAMSILVSP